MARPIIARETGVLAVASFDNVGVHHVIDEALITARVESPLLVEVLLHRDRLVPDPDDRLAVAIVDLVRRRSEVASFQVTAATVARARGRVFPRLLRAAARQPTWLRFQNGAVWVMAPDGAWRLRAGTFEGAPTSGDDPVRFFDCLAGFRETAAEATTSGLVVAGLADLPAIAEEGILARALDQTSAAGAGPVSQRGTPTWVGLDGRKAITTITIDQMEPKAPLYRTVRVLERRVSATEQTLRSALAVHPEPPG